MTGDSYRIYHRNGEKWFPAQSLRNTSSYKQRAILSTSSSKLIEFDEQIGEDLHDPYRRPALLRGPVFSWESIYLSAISRAGPHAARQVMKFRLPSQRPGTRMGITCATARGRERERKKKGDDNPSSRRAVCCTHTGADFRSLNTFHVSAGR